MRKDVVTRTTGVRLGTATNRADVDEWEVVALDVPYRCAARCSMASAAAPSTTLCVSLRQVGDVILVHDESAERRWSCTAEHRQDATSSPNAALHRRVWITSSTRTTAWSNESSGRPRAPIVPEGAVSTYAVDVGEILSCR